MCVCVCVCVCVSHPAPTAIYSLWDLVYFALSKCQHCQSGPPISPGPCCWALPVFISADRWTLRVIPPPPPPLSHLHTHTPPPPFHPPPYFFSHHFFFFFFSPPWLSSLYRSLCLFWMYHVPCILPHLIDRPELPVSPGMWNNNIFGFSKLYSRRLGSESQNADHIQILKHVLMP